MLASRTASVLVACGFLVLVGPAVGAADEGAVIELPKSDREALEGLLGQGVIGDAVAAPLLAASFAGLHEGTWTYQIVGGEGKGGSEQHVVKQLKRDPSGASWRYATGDKHVLFLTSAKDGELGLLSEQDVDQGVISRFDPPEPLLVPGLQAGESKDYTIDVKVFDLSHPDHQTHSGSLKLDYAYIGAYKVTTPNGTQDAALIKWTYEGKVGPANVEDTQYRFVADKIGVVAGIDKKKISALLVYHDDSKVGKVLAKQP